VHSGKENKNMLNYFNNWIRVRVNIIQMSDKWQHGVLEPRKKHSIHFL
jgi:hypothetical protein